VKLFHSTSAEAAREILQSGFRHATVQYVTQQTLSGIWLSDMQLDENHGAISDALLIVEIESRLIGNYELHEEGKGYREWLIPAELLNLRARVYEGERTDNPRRAKYPSRTGLGLHWGVKESYSDPLAYGAGLLFIRRRGERRRGG
jgi:hypothetical protein